MSCFGKRVDVPGGRRKAVRRSVSAAGSAISLDGSRPIVVADVAPTGAKIRGHDLPSVGRQVVIRADDLDVLGSVVWARFGERGLAFDAPVDVSALADLEQQSLERWLRLAS